MDNDNSDRLARAADREVQRDIAETAAAVDEVSRDVRRGAAKVLDAASDGAKKLSRKVKPGVGAKVSAAIDDTARAARRSAAKAEPIAEDARGATLQFVRDHPWGTLAIAAVGGALLTALLRSRR
ncbi:MAG: DUF883 C-terminal domain-containing protein [Rudaea sp.]